MLKIKKYTLIILSFIFLLSIQSAFAVNSDEEKEVLFKAEVIKIIENIKEKREDGSISIRQKVELKGLEEPFKNKNVIYDGTEIDSFQSVEYQVGDKVIVNKSLGPDNVENFYILDYERTSSIYFIAIIFALIVIAIGRMKGLRALIVLFLTFIVIMQYIIPSILNGSSPIIVSIIGSLIILLFAIYITEGFNRNSTIAISSILLALVITGFLSVWFTEITRLTGLASEEGMFLIGYLGGEINLKGLLLAGIIIGTLGVLDDVIISQVMLVQELRNTRKEMTRKQLFGKAMNVGISHLSSMVNTLFLAYAGASLPLLILFSLHEPPFATFNQVLNNEIITTEIVRALTGSIGLILAMPISTFLAVKFGKEDKDAICSH